MAGGRVDRANGIIRGVKLLGGTSANGRRYLESAMRTGAGLYEGAKVNVNHQKGRGDRDYADRIGKILNAHYVEGKGVFGDLHYNPKHALADQLAWDAENSPDSVGLSHDAEGKTRVEGGKVLVESITKVRSVDLVSDPASVKGLYESIGGPAATDDKPEDPDALCKRTYRNAIMELIDNTDDVPATLKKIGELLKSSGKKLQPGQS